MKSKLKLLKMNSHRLVWGQACLRLAHRLSGKRHKMETIATGPRERNGDAALKFSYNGLKKREPSRYKGRLRLNDQKNRP